MAKKKRSKKKTPPRPAARRRRALDGPPVIYIHGIGAQPPADEFKHLWDLALFGRGMGDRTHMVYWADILHADESADAPRTRSARRKPVDVESALAGVAITRRQRERAIAFAGSIADSVAGGPRAGSVSDATVGKRVLPLPRFLRRPIAERFMKWFVKDSAAYFFDRTVRAEIHRRLKAAIPSSGEPFVLISHSQGTVAAYEVLHDMTRRADAALFATLGSPLGLQEVQDLLLDERHDLSVPPKVRAWHNFADPLDPVALDKTLDFEFDPRGEVRVHDHVIVNERTKELIRFNPHSSVGYLANQAVRSIVHNAARFDPASRFVIARDVAEALVDPARRQPVLIEVLHPGYWGTGESWSDMEARERKQPRRLHSVDGRIDHLADAIRREVRRGRTGAAATTAEKTARVQRLRKYVSAHLTPVELERLARDHAEFGIYAVWRSAEKRKLLHRSHGPLKVDASRESYGAAGAGITWAVLDTGANKKHPHFKTNGTVLEVLDCTTTDDEPRRITAASRMDPDGHGTHVAGIIAGEYTMSRETVRGIAPQARLIVYKVLDDDGFGEDAWIIKAIDDIYRRNDSGTGLQVHGANLSLGGSFDPTVYGCGHSPICKELYDIWRQGVLVCVSAGNEGQINVLTDGGDFDLNTQVSVGDPANLEDCIAVGSVNADKPHLHGVSYFSSRGPTADGRAKPDVVAPGERIRSCDGDYRGTGKSSYRNLYRHDSGTSMACPHVSGLLAAFLSVRREFIGRPDEVKEILLANCNDLGRDRYHQGAGLPNLMKMLTNT